MNQPDNSPDDKPNRKKFDPIGLETIELTVSHLFTTKKPSPPAKQPEPEQKKSTWFDYLKVKIDNFAKKFTNLWKMEPTVTENRVKRDFKMFIAPKSRPENPMNNSLQKDNLNQSIIMKRRGERASAKKPSFFNVMNYYRRNAFQNMKGKVNLDQPIKVWLDICEIKAEPQYPSHQENCDISGEFEEQMDPKATPNFVELNNGKRALVIEDSEQEKKFKMLQSSKKLFNKMRRSNKKFGGKPQIKKKNIVNKAKPMTNTNTNTIDTFTKNYFRTIDLDNSDDEEIIEEPKKKLFNNEKRDIVKPKEAPPKLILPPLSTHYKVNPFVKKNMLNKEARISPRNFFESMDNMEVEKPELPFIEEDSIKPTFNFTIPEDQLFKTQEKSVFPLTSSNGTSKEQSQIFSFANLSSSSSFEKEKEEENQHQSFNGFYQFGRSTESENVLSKESFSIDSQSSDSLFKPRNFPAKNFKIEESFLNNEPKLLESSIKVVEVTEKKKTVEKVFAPVDDNIKVRKISSRLRIDEDDEEPQKMEKKLQYTHTPAFGNKVIQPFIFEAGKYREK